MRRLALASLLATVACVSTPAEAAPSYFTVADAVADENAGQIQFAIRRLTAISSTARVRVTTRNGTATSPGDYSAAAATITFAPGESAKVVTITLTDDTIRETTENFALKIAPVYNARIWDDGSATGTITDKSDSASAPPPIVPTSPPSLSVDDVTIAEGAPIAPVVIRKHGVLNASPSTFTIYTINGTATAPGDYTQVQTQITMGAAETSTTVNIALADDIAPEAQEFFSVQLTPVTNAKLYDGTATVTITDSDVEPPPVVIPPPIPPVVSTDPIVCAEAVGNCHVGLWRTGNIAEASTLTWSTTPGTATAGSDYTAATGTVTFPAGVQAGSFQVPITNDTADEPDETLSINLTPVTNITLGAVGNLTIVDDDLPPPPPQMQTCPDGSIIPIEDTCPEAPQQQVDIPSPSLAGLALNVNHNYLLDIDPNGGTPPDAGVDPLGAYRQICGDGFLRKMDPILYPGQEVAGHLHDFSGDKMVDDDSTETSLLNTGEATCNDQPGTGRASQNAVYWITSLLDGVGNVVRPDYNSVYYKRRPDTHVDCGDPALTTKTGICIPFPNGLRMIAGSKLVPGQFTPLNYRTDGGRPVYFNCSGTGAVAGRYANLASAYAASPICPTLAVVVDFPDCWDGAYLWKVDRSHMAYAKYDNNGRLKCPTTHKYKIHTVSIHYFYRTDANWPTYKLASDDMEPTQPRGWSLHADAWLVWDERAKQTMTANCTNRHLNCSGGQLGDGTKFKGAAQPTYGFQNPNRLTPISSLPPEDRPDHTGH
jgi:hypothetical protein